MNGTLEDIYYSPQDCTCGEARNFIKEAFVMKAFMDENFLLETPTAQKLFHEYASQVPVLDYHCHINPQEIAED